MQYRKLATGFIRAEFPDSCYITPTAKFSLVEVGYWLLELNKMMPSSLWSSFGVLSE